MKNNTSPGFDSIDIQVIKKVIVILASPLCKIFNYSLEQGIFPNQMKTARITPIHKKGPKDSMNNYRPIAILPILVKYLKNVCTVD